MHVTGTGIILFVCAVIYSSGAWVAYRLYSHTPGVTLSEQQAYYLLYRIGSAFAVASWVFALLVTFGVLEG